MNPRQPAANLSMMSAASSISRGSVINPTPGYSSGSMQREEKEIQEYFMLRSLMNGDLKILKKELIHVLYKLYIRIIRSQI